MIEFAWITFEQALQIHEQMIDIFGGAPGLRDQGLLKSALSRPTNLYLYQNGSVFDCAATYAEGIVRNHPFIDGNKRTAFSVAGMFLLQQGLELNQRNFKNHETTMVDLAERRIDVLVLSIYLKNNIVPRHRLRRRVGVIRT